MQKRLKDFITYTGLTDAAFAKRCGIRQNTLWTQMRSASGLSGVTIDAIGQSFPELDFNWLIRGEGSMLKSENVEKQDKRIDNLIDVISMQQEIINNLQEKIKKSK